MPALDQDVAATIGVGVRALIADPVVAETGPGWHVGTCTAPSVPDPVAARAARLEARLTVYAQYAAVVAEEAAAAVAGDDVRRAELNSERGATAEHFAELRAASAVDTLGTPAFSDALTDALHELRHQDAVDDALGRRLRALGDATRFAAGRDPGPRSPIPALSAGGPQPSEAPVARLDLRF